MHLACPAAPHPSFKPVPQIVLTSLCSMSCRPDCRYGAAFIRVVSTMSQKVFVLCMKLNLQQIGFANPEIANQGYSP